MHTITLTRDNITTAENNRLEFEMAGQNLEGCSIALSSAYLYYSWTNINAAVLNNNTMEVTLDNSTFYTITFPEGMYEISDINAYLQQWSLEQGLYLTNTNTSEKIYFIEAKVNVVLYGSQINVYSIPSTLPSGYSLPPTGILASLPASITLPGFRLTSKIAEFLGFEDNKNVAAVSGLTTNFAVVSHLSTKAPNVQPNPVIFLNCQQIQNSYSRSGFMYPISANVPNAGLINVEPAQYSFNNLTPGNHSKLTFTLTDRNGTPIKLQDPNMVLSFVIRDHSSDFKSLGPSINGKSASAHSQQYSLHPTLNSSMSQHHSVHNRLQR